MKKLILLAALALLCTSANAAEICEKAVLVTNGTGEIEVKPDYVNINASMNSRDKDIKKAKKQNDDNYAKIIKTITEKFGVKKTDIKGNSVYINPVYKSCYDERGNYKQCDQTKIDFYDVNRSLTIKLTKLENYDAVLSTLAESGFANVSSGQFGVENVALLKDQVRDLAIDSAKAKAKKIANKLEVTLKKPLRFEGYDDSVNYPQVNARAFAKAEMAMDAVAAPPPTDVDALGTIKLNSNVTITYEIE